MLKSPLVHLSRISHSLAAVFRPSSLHTSAPCANMDLRAVVAALDKISPTIAAEPWDNVGLLVEPSQLGSVQRVLITNDLTEPVLEEALSSPGKKVGLIVAYHPPLFKPFKRLTRRCAKERIVVRALEEGVAIYSPHTSLDNMEGGINDWLLAAMGEGQVTALGVQRHHTPYPNLLEISSNTKQLREMAESLEGVGQIHSSDRYIYTHSVCVHWNHYKWDHRMCPYEDRNTRTAINRNGWDHRMCP